MISNYIICSCFPAILGEPKAKWKNKHREVALGVHWAAGSARILTGPNMKLVSNGQAMAPVQEKLGTGPRKKNTIFMGKMMIHQWV